MALPGSQTWMLVRNSSCFLVKRNGVQFSSEPGNVMNLNTYKYSGLANDKTVAIDAGADGKVTLGLKAPKRSNLPAKPAAARTPPLRGRSFRAGGTCRGASSTRVAGDGGPCETASVPSGCFRAGRST